MGLCDPSTLGAVRAWLLSGRPPERTDLQPEALVKVAAAQGLCGLLHAQASRARAGAPAVADLLRRAHHVSVARTERQLAAARQIVALLAENGLRALPLKGAAVADWLYDSPAERAMDDVDLLALDDWNGSRQVLERAGFVERERADHARSYLSPTGVVVELHHSISSCPGLFPLDADGVWARRWRLHETERPGAEDLLVQLALHAAFQHGLALRLIQYLDLRRLLERAPLDSSRVLELARTSHASAAVALALEAAAIVVDAPVPAALREGLRDAWPPGLRAWLERRRDSPEALVDPERPPLLRLRWALARGRRLELWLGTLDDREPGAPQAGLRRVRYMAARVGRLARHWAASP